MPKWWKIDAFSETPLGFCNGKAEKSLGFLQIAIDNEWESERAFCRYAKLVNSALVITLS